MKVDIINKQEALIIIPSQVRRLVKVVILGEKVICNEVAIHFIDTKEISALHSQFFNDPSTKDCISFPLDEPHDCKIDYLVLGDVFVCPETAIEYSARKSLEPYREVSLYIVHGLLHLMGYDDMDVSSKRKMRTAEKRHMSCLEKLGFILKPNK